MSERNKWRRRMENSSCSTFLCVFPTFRQHEYFSLMSAYETTSLSSFVVITEKRIRNRNRNRNRNQNQIHQTKINREQFRCTTVENRIYIEIFGCDHLLAKRTEITEILSTRESPLSTHAFVQCYLTELSALKRPTPVFATQPLRSGAPRWISPPLNSVKGNVDGAVSRNNRVGSVATIFRTSDGVYLGSFAVIFPGVTDPPTLEHL
jgi:hypothetical protein